MKKSAVSAVVFVLMVAVPCLAQKSGLKGRVYYNWEYGYKISLPAGFEDKGWVITDQDPDIEPVLIARPGFFGGLTVIADKEEEPVPLESFFQGMVEFLSAEYENWDKISSRKANFGSLQVRELIFKMEQNGWPIRVIQYFAVNGRFLYSIVCTGLDGNAFPTSDLRTIAGTLRVFDVPEAVDQQEKTAITWGAIRR